MIFTNPIAKSPYSTRTLTSTHSNKHTHGQTERYTCGPETFKPIFALNSRDFQGKWVQFRRHSLGCGKDHRNISQAEVASLSPSPGLSSLVDWFKLDTWPQGIGRATVQSGRISAMFDCWGPDLFKRCRCNPPTIAEGDQGLDWLHVCERINVCVCVVFTPSNFTISEARGGVLWVFWGN